MCIVFGGHVRSTLFFFADTHALQLKLGVLSLSTKWAQNKNNYGIILNYPNLHGYNGNRFHTHAFMDEEGHRVNVYKIDRHRQACDMAVSGCI